MSRRRGYHKSIVGDLGAQNVAQQRTGNVDYQSARQRIKSGHLLSWTHRGFSSFYDLQIQLVRAWTRSEHCHVGIAVRSRRRVYVIEAVRPLVRIFPLSLLVPFYHVPTPGIWSDEVADWLDDQVGKEYSRWQAVLAGVNKLKAGEDDRWQCAELVQEAMWRLGVDCSGPPTPSNIVAQGMKAAGVLYPVE